MRVLLAEDSLTMRRLLVSQLKGWRYEVVEAENGEVAWQEFQRQHFPLVLTDWMMPGVDGLELTRRIRSTNDRAYVYIVLLTAQSKHENLVEAMEAGADDFLGKPCNPRELRVRLRAGERIIELERRLIEQNLQLKEAQAALVQSEKLAGVGQLAAGMAHEINNPIAFVSNNLAVLERDVHGLMELIRLYSTNRPLIEASDSGQGEILQQQEAECDLPWLAEHLPKLFQSSRDGLSRVREIVGNLRDFAHLDEAETDKISVAEAIDATLGVLKPDIDAHDIQMSVECSAANPRVVCQPAKMKQVFHSVIRNAIQASHTGGGIEIQIAEDDSTVTVSVTDHGHGMDETTQQRLFEPFYTTRPVGAGQGLGLAVSYGVVHQHGGSIEFDSELGKGTALRVILPRTPRTI